MAVNRNGARCEENHPCADRLGQYGARAVADNLNLLAADSEIHQATLLNDRVAEAEQRWSTCMADHGEGFNDPGEARESVGLETRSPEATKIAVADFECRASSGLTTTINAVLAELSSDWLEQNALVVDEFVAERDIYVSTARGIAQSLGVAN